MACIAKRRGRYVIDFYDSQRKRRWKTLPKGTTKLKAREAMREIEDQLARGIYLPDKKIPLFLKVAEDWLEHKKPNLRSSTWSVYEGHTRNHFHDLDPLKINRITTARIEKFISEKQTKGMNISTLRKILITLSQVMQYAVRHRYIDYNPVREAERPRSQGNEIDAGNGITILNPMRINNLINAESDQKYKTLFMLAIMSGARQGELLGLKWSDVDWDNSQIRIRRTYNNQSFFDVKTKGSKREIDLGPEMMKALKKWKLACPPNEVDLVFPNKAGNPINHNNMVNRHFVPALEKAKLPKIRFHDLRHTKASLMIEQGENLKYIQTQLGHSSPTVTLNVYAHLMEPANQEAACRYENVIFEVSGSKMVAETKKEVTARNVTP
jgi:integrase